MTPSHSRPRASYLVITVGYNLSSSTHLQMSVDYVSLIAILGPMAAILSAFAAIAIALLAYRQLKLNRHEMETTFRAWMGMAVPVEDTFLAGALLDDGSRIPPQLLRIPEKRASYASRIKSIMLRYQVRNYGQIPASKVVAQFLVYIGQKPSLEDLKIDPEKQRSSRTIMPGASFPLEFKLPYSAYASGKDVFVAMYLQYRYGETGQGSFRSLARIEPPFLQESITYTLDEIAD